MLRGVEEAGLRIAVFLLPALDGGAGRFVELSVDLGVKPELGQPTLHIATLRLGEADLIFGFLICIVGEGRRIDGCRYFAGSNAQTGFSSVRAGDDCQN